MDNHKNSVEIRMQEHKETDRQPNNKLRETCGVKGKQIKKHEEIKKELSKKILSKEQ